MSNLRVPFAVVAGLLLSSGVFLALFQFVNVPLDILDPIKTTVIEFKKLRHDTPVASTRDPRPERPPPQTAPTRTALPTGNTVATEPVPFVPTTFSVPRAPRQPTGGMDRDVVPVVRVPPDYPATAQKRGIEGWVQIQFSVTAAGGVRDAIVVAAEPAGVFEDAALKAIARWRYNPRIDGGVAVERVGLQTVIRFELQK
jgi:periplasmic protein TonB